MTAAAQEIGVTQSALSQRLSSLEADLEITLFIRESKGLVLTEEGQRLFSHAKLTLDLEQELFRELRGEKNELGGTVRIAGYSSISRSLLLPMLGTFLRSNPNVQLDLQSYEISELQKVLATGRAEFVVLDQKLNKPGIIQEHLGVEEYVVIESSKHKTSPTVYLDHDQNDSMTEAFFQFQQKKINYKRSFLGEVYTIIDGVEEGLGRAVMSKHLVESNKKVKIVKGYRPYTRDITLHYYERSFYPQVFKAVRDRFLEGLI